VTERARRRVRGKLRLERGEAGVDPVPVPGILGLLADIERADQVAQHAQIVQRMDVAADRQCDRAHPGAARQRRRQQRRLRMSLVQVFDDRQRLGHHRVAVDQRRDELLPVHCPVRILVLLALA
jgi:hypothetical protein